MTIQILNQSFKGISTLAITRLTDNVVYNWPSPATFNVASNIEEKIQMTRNELGEKARAGTYKMGEMPELTISYEYLQPEMIAYRLGNQLASGNFSTSIPRQVRVIAEDVPADAVTGIYGALTLDAEAIASVTRNSVSVPLTRVDTASFVNTAEDTFAVGAEGALKFSANLVAANEIVTIVTPVSNLAATHISDLLVGPISVKAKLVTSRNTVTLFEAPNASVNLAGANFDFGGEGTSEIGLYLNNVPGTCRAWNMYNTPLVIQC